MIRSMKSKALKQLLKKDDKEPLVLEREISVHTPPIDKD
jgi:hypothetical protein